jgi:hypothetical protein
MLKMEFQQVSVREFILKNLNMTCVQNHGEITQQLEHLQIKRLKHTHTTQQRR